MNGRFAFELIPVFRFYAFLMVSNLVACAGLGFRLGVAILAQESAPQFDSRDAGVDVFCQWQLGKS